MSFLSGKKIALAVLALAVISAAGFFLMKKSSPPNIVFIIIDTLRADHTHMNGGNTAETPELQRYFADDSVCFGASYSNAPWTLPSISSMMTSRFPSEIGVLKRNSKVDEKFPTLAGVLKENGYATHGVITHIFLKKKYGLSRGFDTYVEKIESDNNNLLSITSPIVTDEAFKIIDQNAGRPFFMFLHYFEPHYKYIDHEGTSAYTGPFLPGENEAKKAEIIRTNSFSGADLDYFRECYISEVRFTDTHIGRVIGYLKEKDLYDNTIIVITADHGEEFGERGSLGHGQSLYNEQTRIPFIMKLHAGERKRKTAKVRSVFSNIDIAPTILHAAGLPVPDSFSGKNILDGRDPDPVFMEVNESKYDTLYNQCAIVHDGWKLIRDIESGTFQLYDLKRDPDEKMDQYDSNKKMFFSMHRILKKYIKMMEEKKHISQETALTEEEQKKLETLGYIGN